jgi:hypothetical protein
MSWKMSQKMSQKNLGKNLVFPKIADGKNYDFHARINTPDPSLVFQKPKCPETSKKCLKMGNVRLYFVIATRI